MLAKQFMVWLYHELNGTADPATLDILMGSNSAGSVAIELTGARLVSLDFPGLSLPNQGGSPTTDPGKPVTLRSTIIADAIAFVDPTGFPAPSGAQNRKLMSGLFEVRVDGVKKPKVNAVGSFSVDALFGDGITDPRVHGAEAPVWHGGDLRLVVDKDGDAFFAGWLNELLDGQPEPEREVSITYIGIDAGGRPTTPLLVLTMRGVGVSGADPGLDIAQRSYGFYVQGVLLSNS